MGVAKASLPYGKTTLLAHQTGRLSRIFEEVLVVAKEAPAFDAGPSRLVLDRTSDRLRSTASSARSRRSADRLFVLAVDLPVMTEEVIRIDRGGEPGVARRRPFCPRADGRLQPLAAVWRRSVLPAALARIARGELSLYGLAREVGAEILPEEAWRAGRPLGQLLRQHQHDRAVQRDAGAGMTEEEKPPEAPAAAPLDGTAARQPPAPGFAGPRAHGGRGREGFHAPARRGPRKGALERGGFRRARRGKLSKGDALAVARLAGILAAKKTSEIVPLAHPISLDAVSVECELAAKSREVIVTATASTAARTGVEMEALTAVAGACLALYDMAKSLDRSIEIREIVLLEKTGGRSGTYRREMRGMTIRVAIMTVSDGVAAGKREDRGGPACEEALRASGIAHEIVSREILPDDRQQIARAIRLTAYSRLRRPDRPDGRHGRGAEGPHSGGRAGGRRVRGPRPGREDALRHRRGFSGRLSLAAGRGRAGPDARRRAARVSRGAPPTACARSSDLLPHAIALVRGEKAGHPSAE